MQPDVLLKVLGNSADDFAQLSCQPRGETADAAQLAKLMSEARWAAASGWIARQSKVIVRPAEPDDPSQGAVLEAELATDSASLQIRRLGGAWVTSLLEESQGGGMLADDVVLVTTFRKAARYRRYWTLPDDGAAEIVACRLVGFEELKG